MILEAATDESPETRELLRAKLAGRNEVMDAMIASLEDHLAVPLQEAQAVYRALAASGVYRELVYESGWTPNTSSDGWPTPSTGTSSAPPPLPSESRTMYRIRTQPAFDHDAADAEGEARLPDPRAGADGHERPTVTPVPARNRTILVPDAAGWVLRSGYACARPV